MRCAMSTSRLSQGEMHGLVGENGAGKSTMMKLIAGVYHDFDGEMRVNGKVVHLRSPRDALAAGIGMVHQELSIVPDLTVAENVFLGIAARYRRRACRLGAHEARGQEAARQPRPRHRPQGAHGQPAGRHAAAHRTFARAVLGRADHHSRRADLGAFAAGSAELFAALRRLQGEGQHHRLHLAFPRRRARHLRPRSPSSATAARSSRKPSPISPRTPSSRT